MKNWITSIFICCLSLGFAQDFPEGIAYQAQVHAADGSFLSEVTVGVEFNIRAGSMDGIITWQERHTVDLNELGHFNAIIGAGTSTGGGSATSFAEIDWAAGTYFLEMLVDETNSGTFVSAATQQLMAVPFAFHAKTTSQRYALSDLEDVDTTGIEVGDILRWDGAAWTPVNVDLPDSILFAFHADTAAYADTASFALNCETPVWVDSAQYALAADSANFSWLGNHAIQADSALYADTAGVALYAYNNWGIEGNDNVNETDHFLGTIDSVDLIIKSFDEERMRLKANGRLGIGTADPLTDFHVVNDNGMLFTGTFGTGAIPTEGAGTRMMWYPGKAAFRVGYVAGNQWDDASIGDYSFATGFNTRASGDYASAMGYASYATAEGAFAAGNVAAATGAYSFAAGHNPAASGDHSVAIGRGTIANAESAIAIGYHSTAAGANALSLGNFTNATGANSVAIGYHAEALHSGSFIFNDYADVFDYVGTTAENQFVVKASGGTIFYTSSDLSTGVELLPGAGAWSILSDRNKKENIAPVNAEDYLNRLEEVDVYSWNYIAQDSSIQHIGPMAQDFYQAFELGTDPTRINSGDFDGVNLLLIKALNNKMGELEEQSTKLSEMESELKMLREQRARLETLLLDLEQQIITSNNSGE